MASELFYFGPDTQDLLLACLCRHSNEFTILGPLLKPEYMWGTSATHLCSILQNFYRKYDHYPTFQALADFAKIAYGQDKVDLFEACCDYIDKLKKINTRDWSWVRSITIDFCRERALIVALQISADSIKNGKTPEGGHTKMFDKALGIGQELVRIPTLGEIVEKQSDPENSLLGERLLCRGGSLFLIGPTGIGKSSLLLYLAICAALGKDFFGIRIPKPLTSLIFQCENDEDDLKDAIAGICSGLKLSDEEYEKAVAAIKVLTTDTNGDDFLEQFEMGIRAEPSDLVFVDPILGFFQGDIRSQKDVAAFIRQGLLRRARKFNVGLVAAHHTNKPPTNRQQTVDLTGPDLAYAGSGSAAIGNAARAILVLQSTGSYDIFKLSLGKRAKRADLIDASGCKVKSLTIRHSRDCICWELTTEADHKKLEDIIDGRARVLSLVPVEGTITMNALLAQAHIAKVGVNKLRSLLNVLVETGRLHCEGGTRGKPKIYKRLPNGTEFLAEDEKLDPLAE